MIKFFAFVAFVIVIVGTLQYFGYVDVNFFNKDAYDRERHCEDVTVIYNGLIGYYSTYGRYPRTFEELAPEYIKNPRDYMGHYTYAGNGSTFVISFTDPEGASYTITSQRDVQELCTPQDTL